MEPTTTKERKMSARATWTGTMSFGLVNVPVALYMATEDQDIHFKQLRASNGELVGNKHVGKDTGEDVEYAEIVKGYEVAKGEYVVVTAEELASVAPEKTKTIEITDFVELAEIDPLFYDRPYYVGPGKGSARAFDLLRQAMADTGKVAIATVVMSSREHLVAVRPQGAGFVLNQLLFADELRASPVEASDTALDEREVALAKQLIEAKSASWEPTKYSDSYRTQVTELIEAKANGAVFTPTAAAEPAPVVDLLAALQASVVAAEERMAS
jgi:DNA end-binding protein Ku